MNKTRKDDRELDQIEHEAAAWVLRRDCGLSAAEQDEFSDWLATDPRHWIHFARCERIWKQLDQLAGWLPQHSARPNPDLLAPPARRISWMVPLALAAAAAVAIMAYLWRPHLSVSGAHDLLAVANAPIEERILEDGSKIELNRGAVIRVDFTQGERLVHLRHGEAHFAVAKNQAWPFIVDAGSVRVRAVGTGFNVHLEASIVEVLVTEGRVEVNAATAPASAAFDKRNVSLSGSAPAAPVVEAGERAIVSLSPSGPSPHVARVSAGEMVQLLAWQPRLLDFTAAPLSDIVAEFNRHNPVQLTIPDPELAALRISASFRSDNLEGFVHLLEASFGIRTERCGENQIALRRAP